MSLMWYLKQVYPFTLQYVTVVQGIDLNQQVLYKWNELKLV